MLAESDSARNVEIVLHLRRLYHFVLQRITWFLERYHGIEISDSSVYRILIRNGLRRLPKKVGRRAIHTRRYAKRVTDDIDLNAKLEERERFYNMGRPHGAHKGKTPYDALRSMLE